jgi:outer membrane lipoprotein SlyB
MRSLNWTLGIGMALLLAACSGTPRPIVDTKGVDMEQYRQDLAECEQFGGEVDVVGGTARGAGVGAAVGGAIGAVRGNTRDGAATGAIAGGASSGLRNDRERQEVVKRCMRGRGYRVLN